MAQKAQTDGVFDDEIVPVTVKTRKGEATVASDEQPRTAKLEKIPTLKPAFREGGTVTAANSSSDFRRRCGAHLDACRRCGYA